MLTRNLHRMLQGMRHLTSLTFLAVLCWAVLAWGGPMAQAAQAMETITYQIENFDRTTLPVWRQNPQATGSTEAETTLVHDGRRWWKATGVAPC